jgi:hypothetical protein
MPKTSTSKSRAIKSRSETLKQIGKLADFITQAVSGRSGLSKEEKRELAVVQGALNQLLAKLMRGGEL